MRPFATSAPRSSSGQLLTTSERAVPVVPKPTDPKAELLARKEAAAKREADIRASELAEAHRIAMDMLDVARKRYVDMKMGDVSLRATEEGHTAWKATLAVAKQRFAFEDRQACAKAERSLDDEIKKMMTTPLAA